MKQNYKVLFKEQYWSSVIAYGATNNVTRFIGKNKKSCDYDDHKTFYCSKGCKMKKKIH